jgi:hypothetical protein
MAALQPSSSESSHSSNDSDKRSSSTNYGHIADEPEHVVYRDGSLTWSGGKLRDEDIIIVTDIEGSSIGHIIWSLAPIDSPAESGQPPFELRSTSATNLPQDLLNKYLYQSLPRHLDPDRNDLHVLISTLSGTGLAPDFFEEVLHPLLRAIGLTDSRYNIVRTKSAESVKEFALSVLSANANKGKKQSVVMLSGDGGIVDLINALLESGTRSKYNQSSRNSLCLLIFSLVTTLSQSSHNCLLVQEMLCSTHFIGLLPSRLFIFKVFEHFSMEISDPFLSFGRNSPRGHVF